jgi:hypothetical protein
MAMVCTDQLYVAGRVVSVGDGTEVINFLGLGASDVCCEDAAFLR